MVFFFFSTELCLSSFFYFSLLMQSIFSAHFLSRSRSRSPFCCRRNSDRYLHILEGQLLQYMLIMDVMTFCCRRRLGYVPSVSWLCVGRRLVQSIQCFFFDRDNSMGVLFVFPTHGIHDGQNTASRTAAFHKPQHPSTGHAM